MKIIQSFWTGGRNMLHDNFGWHSPQAHLMAWALSSLNIKKFVTIQVNKNVDNLANQDGKG